MTIQYVFELCGTALFASSGAIVANDKSNADWFGVTFLGLITCLGGGSVRDILLGAYPLVWIRDINVLAAAFTGIIASAFLYDWLKKHRANLFLVETFAVAMFTIIGTQKALNFGVNPFIAAVMGMLSAVMGGVMRDVLTKEVPVLFRKEIYATACMAGALLYVWLIRFQVDDLFSLISSVVVIALIRIVSVKYQLSLPKFKP
jgi:uncharacterized membrane protein YeiH